MRQDFTLFKRGKYYFYYAYENGRRFRKSTKQTTKAEAMAVVLRLQQNGGLHMQKKTKLKFKEYAEVFFTDQCPFLKHKLATGGHYTNKDIKVYHSIIENRLIPHFGALYIDEITPTFIRDWLTNVPEKHEVSFKTANSYFSILRILMQEAVFRDLIQHNPCASVKQLSFKSNSRNAFTADQIKLIFSHEWENEMVKVMAMLSASTGMRFGECAALMPKQIHDGYIEVSQSWEYGYGIKGTKSGKTRTVPLLPAIHEKLQPYIKDSPDALIFESTAKPGVPINHRTVISELRKVLFDLGITDNLTFHSFRHFFNTKLISAGVRSEIVRAVVGHESEEMTEHYLHLSDADLSSVSAVQATIFQ